VADAEEVGVMLAWENNDTVALDKGYGTYNILAIF